MNPTRQIPTFLPLLVLMGSAISSLSALAATTPLPGLFNTGVNDSGVSLTDDSPDTHYTFTAAPEAPFIGQNPLAATSAGGFPIGPWMGDSANSAFITPRANATGDAGNWTYRTTFNVPSGQDPLTAYIHGQSTSDNALQDILLNGLSIKAATAATIGAGSFGAFDASWQITGGFVSGLNTLDFVVNEASGGADAGGYTSLRAEMLSGIATAGRVQIPGLLNSGETAMDGALTADNGSATGWTGLGPGDAPFTPISNDSTGGFPIGPWLGDNTNSTWLSPAGDTTGAEGDFNYSISFDLTGMDPASAEIQGRFAVDNDATFLLNGNATGISGSGFGTFLPFSLTSGFQPGLNTLTVISHNGPGAGPTGLRVEFDSASVMPIPEPGVSLLGLLATAGLLRRRR